MVIAMIIWLKSFLEGGSVMIEGWVKNGDIRIHYLDNTGPSKETTPLVIIPGIAETGEEYEDLIQALLPRRALVVTMRGRGQSDAPESGFTLEHHVSDIEVVVNRITIDKFAIFGYGRGVAYALGYAVAHVDRINGLIIGNYPAMQKDLPEGWSDFFLKSTNRRVLESMTLETLKGIEKDSANVDFLKHLRKIDCPVLILQGSEEGVGLSEDGAKDYLRAMPDARVRIIDPDKPGSTNPKSAEFAETLKKFFQETKNCGIN